MSRFLLAYRIIFWLILPLLWGYTLTRAIRGGGKRYLFQRFGANFPALQNPLWIHCASVGEVTAVAPLLELIQQRHPQLLLLVTTNTPTGAEVLSKRFNNTIVHCYLPLDFSLGVARFLRHTNPKCALIFETELWPELFRQCHKRTIPIVILNGRLSARTLRVTGFIKRLYAETLAYVSTILCRSETDRQHYCALGASPEKVMTLGNIKFSQSPSEKASPSTDPVGRPYWLAASTHGDEELRIAEIWKTLANDELLLVIAPRHPERGSTIQKQLDGLGWRTSLRSRHQPISDSTQIYIADTLGEMPDFMQYSKFVFLGGSLISRGGHNILEPALLGKATIVGPHMENFSDESRELLKASALLMAADIDDLSTQLHRLLVDPAFCRLLGTNAKTLTAKYSGIGKRYLDQLDIICKLNHSDLPVSLD